MEYILHQAGIPFQMRQNLDNTKPDIIIPSKIAYDDPTYPDNKLFMIGVKTTCKDRWRQVTKEAPRIQNKHILTVQRGISGNQLEEMRLSNVSLIVPKSLHKEYPPNLRHTILSIHIFLDIVRRELVE